MKSATCLSPNRPRGPSPTAPSRPGNRPTACARRRRARAASARRSARAAAASGRVLSPRASFAASCRARSPAGKASGWPRQNRRKISAVQGPTPLTATSAVCASSASMPASPARSSPRSATASATPRNARIFGDERPQARKSSSVAAASPAASSGAMRASRRPKMALALATDTCCETMIAARPAKPGSRRRRGGGPPIAISVSTRSGSFARKASAAWRKPRLVRDRRSGMIDPFRGAALRARPCAGALPYASVFQPCAPTSPRDLPSCVSPRRRTAFCISATLIRRFATSASPGDERTPAACALKTWTARVASRSTRRRSRRPRLARHSLRGRARAGRASTRATTPLRSTAWLGAGLVYPCFCSRAEVARAFGRPRSRRRASLWRRLPRAFRERARVRAGARRASGRGGSTCGARAPASPVGLRLDGIRRGNERRSSRPRSPRAGATSSSAGAILRRATISR